MKRIITLFTLSFLLFSCSKEKTTGNQETVYLAKSMEQPGKPNSKITMTYDGQNRISSFTYSDGSKSSYLVTGNQVQAYLYENYPNWHIQGTGTLDANGNLVVFNGTEYDNGNTYPYKFEVEYDALGQMTKSTETTNSAVYMYEYTWSNGNISKIKEYKNGTFNQYYTYTYYSDKINKSKFDHMNGFAETTSGITGKQNKNLIETTKIFTTTDQLKYQDNYQYELNAAGFITRQIRTYVQTNSVFETIFNY